jgi:hypothetical protein
VEAELAEGRERNGGGEGSEDSEEWLERLGLSYVCYALEYVEASFGRTKRSTRGSKTVTRIRGQSKVDYQAKGPRPLVQD